jgi:anti-anti-sigma factor
VTIITTDPEQFAISVNGNLNKESVERELTDSVSLRAGQSYTLDLAGLELFDSAGLAYLVNLIAQHKNTDGEIELVNCSKQVRQLIDLSELDGILSIRSN